jgi:threonylcarbamoyladenosine tRNA methylthiotransferase CDKAL1
MSIEDIEDLTAPDENTKRLPRYQLNINFKTQKADSITASVEDDKENIDAAFVDKNGENFLPGRQTIFIKTWGCSHNNSDSEYMAGMIYIIIIII